ncbi:MAG: transglutaminase-like domain-containing protein [Thermoanaerobaculales bacterium]
MKRSIAVGVFALILPVFGSGDEARYFLPTALAAQVEAGMRSGLSIGLEAVPGGAIVTVSEPMQALAGSPPFPLVHPERSGDPTSLEVPPRFAPVAELAGVRRGTVSSLSAVRAVVDLVSRRILLDENDRGPQDATSVLRRGRARCSGRANLAVGLLRVLGIPARPLHGIVVGERGPRYHRWGEAWLGSLGWLAFDPGESVGLVSVRHIPLAQPGSPAQLEAIRVEALDDRGFFGLPIERDLRWLPAGGATLRCIAPKGGAGFVAALLAPDGSRWIRQGLDEVVFEHMLPGRYCLAWSSVAAGSRLELTLGAAARVRVDLGGEGVARL